MPMLNIFQLWSDRFGPMVGMVNRNHTVTFTRGLQFSPPHSTEQLYKHASGKHIKPLRKDAL